jgi:hypothetical protein
MGKGWKPRVWENLGWHWSVVKGVPIPPVWSAGFLEITPPYSFEGKDGTYTAWVQSTPQFIVNDKNPKTALYLAVKDFDEHLANLKKLRKIVGTLI